MSTRYRGTTLEGNSIEVEVDGERIVAVQKIATDEALPLIAPPLVDLQHNGAKHLAFNRVHESPQTLETVAKHALRHGVGRLLATITTQAYEDSLESLKAIDRQLSADSFLARCYPGIFFEGNYMSAEYGWRGVHPEQFMRDPSWAQWEELYNASGRRIVKFNIDPSRSGALETIHAAATEGILVSMGHCGPDPDTIKAAVEAGATLVTHLGNGAPPEIHRHRNPFWTWLADDRIRVGLIPDGYHLPGDFLRTALKVKGDGAYLVSDSASTAGLEPGVYGGSEIQEGGFTHMKGNQEQLAGAWHQLDRGVERLCELGWTLAAAWRQASVVPAAIIGLELPRIEAGALAEFVLAHWDGKVLELQQVVAAGKQILDRPVHPREL
jgi:N-acetylglucosamine-6-phosphate deacetylase